MVLEGPLIHHLEVHVAKQGFVLAVLPFGKIQTRFCISWPTIQNHLGNQHCTVISPFKTTIANGFKWCINLHEKGSKSRRVNMLFVNRLVQVHVPMAGMEFHGGHGSYCPCLGLDAPYKYSHRHSDILIQVPYTRDKWPFPLHVQEWNSRPRAVIMLQPSLLNSSTCMTIGLILST